MPLTLWDANMNTAEFLRFVLPRKGLYFSATPNSFIGKDGKEVNHYKHACFNTIGELAEHCVDLSDDGRNAFFACSSYKNEYIEVERKGEIKRKQRVHDNAAFARAQWVDIDCGNDEYPTQKDGMAGLVKFCKDTGITRPNVIVNSGNGIHCYWVFSDDIEASVWQKSAKLFKAIQARFDFAQTDTTRSADVSSVLRPIGTNNDKTAKGLGIKPVSIIGSVVSEPISFPTWLKKLIELRDEYGVVVPKGRQAPSKNSALSGGMTYDPSNADKIANRCHQIRIFRDDMGANQDEPTWRACLGVVGFCENGEDYATKWSSGYEGYDEEATLDKMEQWMDNAGPTSCEHFKSCNPKGCEGCKWQGKITSPIVLGRPDPEHKTEVTHEVKVEVVTTDESTGEDVVVTTVEEIIDYIPEFPEHVSKDYRWDGKNLLARKKDEDGEDNWVPFCAQLPVPEYRFFCYDEKTWKWHVRALVRPGTWNEGDIKNSDMAKGGQAFLGALGGNVGILPRNTGVDLVNFMRTWSEAVMFESEEVSMHNHFGWYDDGSFLLGTRKYMPDGSIKEVRTSASLANYVKGFTPRGTLERHIELVDKAYNRPNHEQYQFTYLSGFASILIRPVHGATAGIPLVTWSRESGYGKTTAAQAALSIYGDPHAPNQMASANKITEYATYLMAGTRRDLPVVLDEVTMWEPKRSAKFAYDYSDGRPKVQGQASGGLRDNSNYEWSNIIILTGNRSIVNDMVSTIPDCAPQVARVIEYQYGTSHSETMDRAEGLALFDELMKNCGHAGDVYLRYVVANRDVVVERCIRNRDALAEEAGVGKDGRFWLLGTSVVWTAFEIATELGLVKFDKVALRRWIIEQIKSMQGAATEANTDVLEMFGEMMAEMQRGLIVTDTEGDRRLGKPACFMPGFGVPNSTITGRVVYDKKTIYLSQAVVRDWCVKKGINYREMELQLTGKGWLRDVKRVALGKGTVMSVPQMKCMELDLASFETNLSLIQGEIANVA